MDNLKLLIMSVLPNKAISRLVGKLAGSSFSKAFIPHYIKYYQINLDEVEKPLSEFTSLTDFFVRKLKKDHRKVDEGSNSIVSPVDGVVSIFGDIENGLLIQAKGIYFTVNELLGNDEKRAMKYNGGKFMTIYLSPKNYHRIHSPLAGQLKAFTYVPGTLFPVNAFGVRAVKGLFAKNERLITYFDTDAGEVAVIKVGATNVGSIKVNYNKITTNVSYNKIIKEHLPDNQFINKGEEIGRFEFGSTVILLFEKDKVSFDQELQIGQSILMGAKIGGINKKD